MNQTVLTSLTIEDFQTVIMDCVNACLKHNNLSERSTQIPDRWFNLQELSEYHPDKPTKATIYAWVSAGLIPVHKSGKRLRFLKSEIDAWLLQGRKKTQAEIQGEAATYVSLKTRGGKL